MSKTSLFKFLIIISFFIIIDFCFSVYVKYKATYINDVYDAIFSKEDKLGYISQPYLNYINNPNQIDSKHNKPVNNKGIRYPKEISANKADSTFRILFLGGSTTFGDVEDDYDVFPALIEKKLTQKISSINVKYKYVECLNAGVHGLTSAEILNHYQFKYQYLSPDLIVVHTGFNDAFAYSGINKAEYQPDYHNIRRVFYDVPRPEKIEKILMQSALIRYIMIKNKYSIYLENTLEKNVFYSFHNKLNWFENGDELKFQKKFNAFYNNYTMLALAAEKKDQKILFVPEVADSLKILPHLRKNLLNGLNVNKKFLIDISNEFSAKICLLPEEKFTTEHFLNDDGIHVNKIGEELKAKYIYECISDMLIQD
jgi:lysophospholipase L1-like esterase